MFEHLVSKLGNPGKCRFVQRLGPFWRHVDHFGALFGSRWRLWGHFWSTWDALFMSKTDWGAKGAPRGARGGPPPKYTHPFGHLLETIVHIFSDVRVKTHVCEEVPFFLRFLGRRGRFVGWVHMQSVRACAVETHFSVFAVFLKIGSLKGANGANLVLILVYLWRFL